MIFANDFDDAVELGIYVTGYTGHNFVYVVYLWLNLGIY